MSETVTLTLPDGATRAVARGTSAAEVAADISRSLAKAALAARIDGSLVDLSRPIETDAALAILTAKDDDPGVAARNGDAEDVVARRGRVGVEGHGVTIPQSGRSGVRSILCA